MQVKLKFEITLKFEFFTFNLCSKFAKASEKRNSIPNLKTKNMLRKKNMLHI